mgnify:CR=1 FL=1
MKKNKFNKKKYNIKKKLFYIFCLIICFLCQFKFGTYFSEIKPKYKDRVNKNLKLDINNFKSYSQDLEDFILYCILYDIENGFYIDVGANDPDIISVTKAFYLKGWYGINIEPLQDKYLKLIKARERDINLNCGAGKIKDKLIFYIQGAGTTADKRYGNIRTKNQTIEVHRMSNICKKYVPKNEIIQFCKIDVEGGEKNVLLGYDFKNYRPKVFCIESTKPGTAIPTYDEWEYILLNNDYIFGFKYGINRYYYDKKIEHLNERFLNLSNNIAYYKRKIKNITNI